MPEPITNTKNAVPLKRYRVIYADPPWSFQQTGPRGADRHYDLMSLDDIKGMGDAVRALASDDSVLLLWVTNAGLQDGLDTMRAWSFTYKTNAVWDKYYMGLGQIVRGSHELLLIGTKGRPKVKFRGQRSTLHFPRMEHSVKPAEMVNVIGRLFDGPYLELFARVRPNSLSDWDWWGNESPDSTISLAKWGYFIPADFETRDVPEADR